MVKDSVSTQDATPLGLVVVLHWTDELKALLQ
jgi:hypothetical protein